MATIIVYLDGEEQSQHTLNKERMDIGRRPGNDIQLLNPTVSGNHARITTIRGDSFLEDMNSTNGVRVNGKPVQKCLLKDGDDIQLGKFTLRYTEDVTLAHISSGGEPAEARSRIVHDAVWTGGRESVAQTEMMPKTTMLHGASGAPDAVLQILAGPGKGKELPLQRTLTTLGKPGVQVAVVTRRADGYFLAQVEGEGHVLLNGKAVTGSGSLHPGDEIEVAGTQLVFQLKAASH